MPGPEPSELDIAWAHLTRDDVLRGVDRFRKLVLAGDPAAKELEPKLWQAALRAIAEGKHGTDPPALIAEAALRTRELGL